jgi:hypothetical protein
MEEIKPIEIKSNFRVSDKVRSISNPEFDMVIKEFAVKWTNNMYNESNRIPNLEYPICTFYNIHSNKWEERTFLYTELELVSRTEKKEE